MAAPTAVESAPEPAETRGLASASSLVPSRSRGQGAEQLLGVAGDVVHHVLGVLLGQPFTW